MSAEQPWWANDPMIEAARDRALAEIQGAAPPPLELDGPTPCWHSWGDIGRVLGVPRQVLHRRFGDAS